jgi:3-isopropylmalate dehydratase small subunit
MNTGKNEISGVAGVLSEEDFRKPAIKSTFDNGMRDYFRRDPLLTLKIVDILLGGEKFGHGSAHQVLIHRLLSTDINAVIGCKTETLESPFGIQFHEECERCGISLIELDESEYKLLIELLDPESKTIRLHLNFNCDSEMGQISKLHENGEPGQIITEFFKIPSVV